MRRHLLEKVGVAEVGAPRAARHDVVGRHAPGPVAARRRATWRSSRAARSPRCRPTPSGTRSTRCRRSRSATPPRCSARTSACAASSPTRTSRSRSRRAHFTLRELAEIYEAVLGYAVDATHLRRVLERDHLIAPTGERRSTGGRPAEEFRVLRRRSSWSRGRSRRSGRHEEREVERRRRVRERAERDVVHAGLGDLVQVGDRDAAAGLELGAAVDVERPSRAARAASCCRAAGAARRRRAPRRRRRGSRTRPRAARRAAPRAPPRRPS